MTSKLATRFRICARLICALGAATTLGCEREQPNIILLIGDDHGYPYYGLTGSEIVQTPNLDRLAEEGVTFTHAFNTASTCRPSLMSLLTGLYPGQWNLTISNLRDQGISRVPFMEIVDFETLPGLLRQKGYVSFQGGKYWEGTYASGGFTHGMKSRVPGRPGLDVALRNAGGLSLSLGRTTMQPLWNFLDEFGGQTPFFVWFAPMLPHTPFDAGAAYLQRYDGLELSAQSKAYYANITRFDDLVGSIVDYLERHGLRENTLLVYLSDNGWDQDPDARHGPTGGPRGKWSMYELGFRTPLIFSWPGQLPRGVRNDLPISTVDVVPTLLDFADVALPSDRRGRSLKPVLNGHARKPRKPVIMVGDHSSSRSKKTAFALRNDSWHFIWRESGKQLFAIDRDPHEQVDLAEAHPELVLQFRLEILRWIAEMGFADSEAFVSEMGYRDREEFMFEFEMLEIEHGSPVDLIGLQGALSQVRLAAAPKGRGIIVQRIREGGVAWTTGFRNADVLLSVSGRQITNLRRGLRLLSNAPGSEPIVIEVQRGAQILPIEIRPTEE
ncbi:MAG: sulfatase-like hydrolase/transferase [Myxococcales bacterium]|nr:sulfatase-like hydrolase/transferase [Myxococcales bacterium]